MFSSWLRSNILPLLKSGAKYAGKQLLFGTANAAKDVIEGAKPSEAIRVRMKDVGRDILSKTTAKLRGEGGRGPAKRKCKRLAKKKKKASKNKKKKTKAKNKELF